MDILSSPIYRTIAIVLVFGLAVFVHEFGHMIFAIMRKVKVESFAIGMGPKICAWHWFGIEFSLRWFPVGGFVKLAGLMPGETEEDAADGEPAAATSAEAASETAPAQTSDQPTADRSKDKSVAESSYDDLLALSNKGLVTKLLVFGGGVFMNFVTAIAAMAVLLMLPDKVGLTPMEIWKVGQGSRAEAVGFQAGDRVVAIDGKPLEYSYELDKRVTALAEERGIAKDSDAVSSMSLTFTVRRGSESVSETVALAPIAFGHLLGDLKYDRLELAQPPILGHVNLTQPADKAGLQIGDRILSVDGTPVKTFNDMAEIIGASLEKQVTLEYDRAGEIHTATLTPIADYDAQNEGRIGVASGAEAYSSLPGLGFGEAVSLAPRATVAHLDRLIFLHVDFFKKATLKQVGEGMGGPVMIARLTNQAAGMGPSELISFFITLNLLLMVFNLLPLPVLDGGFIVISIIESAMRRPVPPKVLVPVYTFFVIFFIGLMVLITFWDVKRWIS
jgi:regulator of sigma E protease